MSERREVQCGKDAGGQHKAAGCGRAVNSSPEASDKSDRAPQASFTPERASSKDTLEGRSIQYTPQSR